MQGLRSIPIAPNAFPVVGHLVQLLRDPTSFLESLSSYGELVRVRLGPFTLVVICDPELTHQALVEDRVFDKGGLLFDRVREVAGDGLVSCPHRAHRRLRRLAQPAFQPTRIPGYVEAMTAYMDEATSSWHAGQVLDVPTEMKTISAKVTAATLFSGTLSAADLGQALDDVKTVFDGFFQRLFLIGPLDRLPTPNNRSYQRARTQLRDFINQIIAERRAAGTDHGDLLSALVEALDPEDNAHGMTDAEISDAVVTIFLAGTETTAAVLSWALDLIARHPEIERRLRTEVETVLGSAAATYADLPRLELTRRIVTETLRLRPPAWFLTRLVTADTRLGRHLLPTGTNIVYSPYLIHHRPDIYNNPERFDPDRWAAERPQPHRHAFIPFAAGARKCIGESFAVTEAAVGLATISARWRLEHVPGLRVRPALGSILRPRELHMRATPATGTTAVR